jgi:hypothetical protein
MYEATMMTKYNWLPQISINTWETGMEEVPAIATPYPSVRWTPLLSVLTGVLPPSATNPSASIILILG